MTDHPCPHAADREHRVEHAPARAFPDRSLFLSGLIDTAVALATAPVSPETAALLHQRRPA